MPTRQFHPQTRRWSRSFNPGISPHFGARSRRDSAIGEQYCRGYSAIVTAGDCLGSAGRRPSQIQHRVIISALNETIPALDSISQKLTESL